MFEPIPQQLYSSGSRGLSYVGSGNDKGYYIDVNGKTVIPNITNGAFFSENGLAIVDSTINGSNGKYYIDTDGNIAF